MHVVRSLAGDDPGPDESTRLRGTGGATGFVLRVATPGAVFSFPFPTVGTISFGRGNDVDLRIPMADMSRRHATLRWSKGSLFLADLGSSNGTVLRGQRLEPNVEQPLAFREPFFIGDAALVVHEGNQGDGPRRLVGHEAFESALRTQLAAYAQTQRPFAVITVELDCEAAWMDAAVALLGKGDVVGYLSETKLGLVLVERRPEEVALIADFIDRSLAAFSSARKLDVRACPRDGDRVSTLFPSKQSPPSSTPEELRRSPARIQSAVMRKVYTLVDEVAPTNTSILVLGETGAGKDVLARTIHERSRRAAAPFVGLNCAALPESLLESELFGYERGAFTGAVAAKPGLLESAHGGTVFLDELGEMPLTTQAKLLRVLEERTVMRLGGLRPKSVDFRLVAATNRNLHAEIAAGRFRADLFYRINGFAITIPPLRERREEIVPLALDFAERAAVSLGKKVPTFSAAALAVLEHHTWPGNVRELRSVVERAVLLARSGTVLPEHLPDELAPAPPPKVASVEETINKLPVLYDDDEPPRAQPLPTTPTAFQPRGSLKEEVERLEYERIVNALKEYGGNQTRAAQALGMTRRALIIRLERFGLPRPRKPND
jgi:transcriptional regulator with GAF, ATPase, and Fis domain